MLRCHLARASNLSKRADRESARLPFASRIQLPWCRARVTVHVDCEIGLISATIYAYAICDMMDDSKTIKARLTAALHEIGRLRVELERARSAKHAATSAPTAPAATVDGRYSSANLRAPTQFVVDDIVSSTSGNPNTCEQPQLELISVPKSSLQAEAKRIRQLEYETSKLKQQLTGQALSLTRNLEAAQLASAKAAKHCNEAESRAGILMRAFQQAGVDAFEHVAALDACLSGSDQPAVHALLTGLRTALDVLQLAVRRSGVLLEVEADLPREQLFERQQSSASHSLAITADIPDAAGLATSPTRLRPASAGSLAGFSPRRPAPPAGDGKHRAASATSPRTARPLTTAAASPAKGRTGPAASQPFRQARPASVGATSRPAPPAATASQQLVAAAGLPSTGAARDVLTSTLKVALADLTRDNSSLRSQMVALHGRIHALEDQQAESHAAQGVLADIHAAFDAQRSTLASVQSELTQERASSAQMRRLLTNAHTQIEALVSQRDSAQLRAAAQRNELETLAAAGISTAGWRANTNAPPAVAGAGVNYQNQQQQPPQHSHVHDGGGGAASHAAVATARIPAGSKPAAGARSQTLSSLPSSKRSPYVSSPSVSASSASAAAAGRRGGQAGGGNGGHSPAGAGAARRPGAGSFNARLRAKDGLQSSSSSSSSSRSGASPTATRSPTLAAKNQRQSHVSATSAHKAPMESRSKPGKATMGSTVKRQVDEQMDVGVSSSSNSEGSPSSTSSSLSRDVKLLIASGAHLGRSMLASATKPRTSPSSTASTSLPTSPAQPGRASQVQAQLLETTTNAALDAVERMLLSAEMEGMMTDGSSRRASSIPLSAAATPLQSPRQQLPARSAGATPAVNQSHRTPTSLSMHPQRFEPDSIAAGTRTRNAAAGDTGTSTRIRADPSSTSAAVPGSQLPSIGVAGALAELYGEARAAVSSRDARQPTRTAPSDQKARNGATAQLPSKDAKSAPRPPPPMSPSPPRRPDLSSATASAAAATHAQVHSSTAIPSAHVPMSAPSNPHPAVQLRDSITGYGAAVYGYAPKESEVALTEEDLAQVLDLRESLAVLDGEIRGMRASMEVAQQQQHVPHNQGHGHSHPAQQATPGSRAATGVPPVDVSHASIHSADTAPITSTRQASSRSAAALTPLSPVSAMVRKAVGGAVSSDVEGEARRATAKPPIATASHSKAPVYSGSSRNTELDSPASMLSPQMQSRARQSGASSGTSAAARSNAAWPSPGLTSSINVLDDSLQQQQRRSQTLTPSSAASPSQLNSKPVAAAVLLSASSSRDRRRPGSRDRDYYLNVSRDSAASRQGASINASDDLDSSRASSASSVGHSKIVGSGSGKGRKHGAALGTTASSLPSPRPSSSSVTTWMQAPAPAQPPMPPQQSHPRTPSMSKIHTAGSRA